MPWSSLNIADIWKIFILNLKLYDNMFLILKDNLLAHPMWIISISLHLWSIVCPSLVNILHFDHLNWKNVSKSLWGPLQPSSFLLDTAKTWLLEAILPLFINIILFFKSYLKLKVQMIYFGLDLNVCGVLYKNFLIYHNLGGKAAMGNSCFWWAVI